MNTSNKESKSSTVIPFWIFSVFEFSDWQTRKNIMMLSKSYRYATNTGEFFRYLCDRLSAEHHIYINSPNPNETWRSLFMEQFKIRNLWCGTDPSSDSQYSERFKVNVYARFRPKSTNEDGKNDNSRPSVTLPLHQRLSMIRMSHRLGSNSAALKILAAEGAWFESRWGALLNTTPSDSADKENTTANSNASEATQDRSFFAGKPSKPQVAALRALRHKDTLNPAAASNGIGSQVSACVHSLDTMNGRVVMVAPDVGLREFNFDGILSDRATQKLLYDSSTKRLVMDFINGFNATAIVYGQTGSGKSYSMFGRSDTAIFGRGDIEGQGVVPRTCEEVFAAVKARQISAGIESTLSVSYVEVFGNEVSDLLRFGARCGHSQVAAQRFVLQGTAERVVNSPEEVAEVLRIGEMQKRRAATAMNDRSSRAHSLFILSLKQRRAVTVTKSSVKSGPEEGDDEQDVTITSKLFLADLGGSEQVSKSKVDAGAVRVAGEDAQFSLGFELGDRMRETVNINLGLLALKKCIEALNNRAAYVPFKDSKLTMLLSEGLGGNSKTSIIVCGSMEAEHASETIATMRFGERCAQIELQARNNATMLASVLEGIDAQIQELEKLILEKERWEMREEKRSDVLAEEGTFEAAMGGVEFMKVSVLAGAEKERMELEKLLIQRAKFTGDVESLRDMNATEEGLKGDGRPKKAVVGFGKDYAKLYGLGEKFDEIAEFDAKISRFSKEIDDENNVPVAVRAKGGKNWVSEDITAADLARIEKKADKAKRSRLAYAGFVY